jgi:hypothetical protein
MDLFNYFRRETTEVNIGAVPLGGPNSIRVQSMTNTSTQDTQACVEQAKRIVDAGGEYVRLTTQGIKEAENLMNINIGLRSQGYMVPLVADVHFNPKVADVAAQYAEKMLRDNGIYDVTVTSTSGMLTDHYNPMNKTVNLSEGVYGSTSVAAAAVAAHECGHAVQHARGYAPLRMRSALVPVVQFSSSIVSWVLLAGILMVNSFPQLLLIGICLFAMIHNLLSN